MNFNITITDGGVKKRVRSVISDDIVRAYIKGGPYHGLTVLQKVLLNLVHPNPNTGCPFSMEGKSFTPSGRASQKLEDSFERMLFLGVQANICIAVYNLAVCRTDKLATRGVDLEFQKHFLYAMSDVPLLHYKYLDSVLHRLAVPACGTTWALVKFFALHYLNNPITRPRFDLVQEWAHHEVLGFSLALVLREDGAEEKFFGLFLGKYKKIVSDFIYQEIIGRKTPPSELEEKIKLAFDIKNLLPTKKLEEDDFL